MEKQAENSGGKSSGTKTGLFIFAGFVLLSAVIAVAAYFYINAPKSEEEPIKEIKETADGRGIVLTKDNMDEVFSGETVDPGYFETNMTNEWTFVSGKSGEDVFVGNANSNTNTIYFDLFVDNGQKLVYSSPYIPVGAELPQFELTESLSAGDYQGTVTYHLVDEQNKEISDVSVAVTLHIK